MRTCSFRLAAAALAAGLLSFGTVGAAHAADMSPQGCAGHGKIVWCKN